MSKRNFGLIGYPLGHSFSAGYFSKKFKAEGIANCEYKNYPIEKIDEFPALLKSIDGLTGLNVTIPYKEAIIPFLDELDENAREIGAVNTIKIERTDTGIKTRGFNTDVVGFWNALQPHLPDSLPKALILGTGGAAKAVKWVLQKNGIETLFVSRTPKENGTIAYSEVTPDIIASRMLIINTSPIGMHPNVQGCPNLPYCSITPNHILYDLVYNPEMTRFLKKGKQKKATLINGLPMLYGQADEAWRIWNR